MPRLFILALLGSLPAAPAFAQAQDHAPTELRSAGQLQHGKGETWTYVKPGLSLSAYTSVIVDPTAVYRGPDAQFENIAADDRTKFATMLTDALRGELGGAIALAPKAGPGVLRIRMTLLGAEKTTGGVSTASHVMPVGLATNAVKSFAGKRGSMTGSVLIAIEITDAQSGELLAAAVRRVAPDALDIPATLSTSDTVKAIARDLAKRVRERLQKAMGRD